MVKDENFYRFHYIPYRKIKLPCFSKDQNFLKESDKGSPKQYSNEI